jgi:monofunctional biosynthetic peptidoglycan transglycosylase
VKKLALGVLVALAACAFYFWWGLPSRSEVRTLAETNPGKTSVMQQREDEARRAGRTPRTVQSWVPISRISRHLVHAVVAAEDQKFFGHEGVDWDAIKESVEVNRAQHRFARGGSTITQQLAKNLFFTTHKTITRKLRELIAARWLEDDLSKRRILELYLNVIEWGDGLYGCQAAAERYYGKACSDLGPDEAAGLAGMIPNPRRINPQVTPARYSRAQRRVLWLMGHAGYAGGRGLGAEPPPVEVDEEEEGTAPVEAAEPTPSAHPSAPAQTPSAEPSPEPIESPTPAAPSPTPQAR